MEKKARFPFKLAFAIACLVLTALLVHGSQASEQSPHKLAIAPESTQIQITEQAPLPAGEDELRKKKEQEKKRQEEIKRMAEDLLPGLLGKPAPAVGQTPGPAGSVRPSPNLPPAAIMPQPIMGSPAAPTVPAAPKK